MEELKSNGIYEEPTLDDINDNDEENEENDSNNNEDNNDKEKDLKDKEREKEKDLKDKKNERDKESKDKDKENKELSKQGTEFDPKRIVGNKPSINAHNDLGIILKSLKNKKELNPVKKIFENINIDSLLTTELVK